MERVLKSSNHRDTSYSIQSRQFFCWLESCIVNWLHKIKQSLWTCALFAKRVAPMWEYPPNTAFVLCLYLCFCELFEESGHRTLCQNIASV